MLKPLSTQNNATVKNLLNLIKEQEIPGDAKLTLKYHKNGMPYLLAYWSEGPGSFGETLVNFEIEFNYQNLKNKPEPKTHSYDRL